MLFILLGLLFVHGSSQDVNCTTVRCSGDYPICVDNLNSSPRCTTAGLDKYIFILILIYLSYIYIEYILLVYVYIELAQCYYEVDPDGPTDISCPGNSFGLFGKICTIVDGDVGCFDQVPCTYGDNTCEEYDAVCVPSTDNC